MPEHLTEYVADWRGAVVVERGTRTIRNVALAGTESKNGYRYRETALQAALPLYENTPVFLDHPSSVQRPRDRSARDLAGSVANVRFDGGRLRGDIRTLDTEAGRTLLALADADGPGVGMSHVVLAERSTDGATVDRIVDVISVDAVVFPATTQSFRESMSDAETVSEEVSLARKSDDKRGRHRNIERITRVRTLMNDSRDSRTGVARPTQQQGVAKPSASSSDIARSARVSRPQPAGSLERLLASVDAQLPGHLRRLAAAPGSPGRGRGVRVGVFPTHILVEWRTSGGPPEPLALTWRFDGDRLVLGDSLISIDEFTEQTTWRDVLSSVTPSHETQSTGQNADRRHSPSLQREGRQRVSTPVPECHDEPRTTLERLAEQLRQTAAERDRLAARLAERGPTSIVRRATQRDAIADEQFVQTIKRR